MRNRPQGVGAQEGDAFLIRVTDASLIGVIGVAPLCMGGRHPLGELIVSLLVFLAAVSWLTHQCLRPRSVIRLSGAEWIVAAGVLIVAVQFIPVSTGFLSSVSPGIKNTLPVWTGASVTPVVEQTWSTVSLVPRESIRGLSLFAAYGLFFVILVQRLQTLEDVEKVLRWLAMATAWMAVIGLAQFLAGNGRYLWFYEHPFRDASGPVKGTFINRNHFAHFVVLGIGPLIWWSWHTARSKAGGTQTRSDGWGRSDRDGSYRSTVTALAFLALGVSVISVALSLSRGGVLTLAASVVVCICLLYPRRLISGKPVLALFGVLLFSGVGISLYGTDKLEERLQTLVGAKSVEEVSHGRGLIWETLGRAIPDYLWLGSGVGTHRYVYPRYLETPTASEFSHAENGYLQVLLETGIAGCTLLVVTICFCFRWLFKAYRNARSERQSVCVAAVAAGIVCSLLHSGADFVWYIPACMSLTIVLIACAWRLSRLSSGDEEVRQVPLPRPVWAAGLSLVAVGGYFVIQVQAGPALAQSDWDRFYRISLASGDLVLTANVDTLDQRIESLEGVISKDPHNAVAHLNLASLLRQKFEFEQQSSTIPMPLAQIRDAARNSAFEDHESLSNWLDRILEERRDYLERSIAHLRQAIELCPLQGEAYVFLSELSFLRDWDSDVGALLIDQGKRTRPMSPSVLLSSGNQELLAGNEEAGLELYQKVFQHFPKYRSAVIRSFGRMGVDFFLNSFPFDSGSLPLLRNHLASMNRDDESRIVGEELARQLVDEARGQSGPEGAVKWREVGGAFQFLGQKDQVIQAARNAIACDPHEYSHRKHLIGLLMAEERFEDAVPLLEWCLQRYPENEELKRSLLRATNSIKRVSFEQSSSPIRHQ